MCTAIKIDYKDGIVMGRTMDYEVPLKYRAIYFPRDYEFCLDLEGNMLKSKYKTMGVCFENRDPLKDGVNEHGLVGLTNAFQGFNLYGSEVEEGKVNISSLDYLTYCLSHYKSVDELVEDLPNMHLASKNHLGEDVICPDFHYMFSDSTKRCVVVEPRKGKLTHFENPYKVMTNSPRFDSHVKRLKKLIDLDELSSFNSAKDLPGGYDPVSRFIKAFYLSSMNREPSNVGEAFSNIYNILGVMTMPEGFVKNQKYSYTTYTRYICAYDSVAKIMTVKSHTNPQVYELRFEDIEDQERRQIFLIEENFTSASLKGE